MPKQLDIKSLKEFYLYYLTQHWDYKCRMFHFTGTSLVIITFVVTLVTQIWWLLLALPVIGYGFAWSGHALFEHNRPAAFSNPWWSFLSDFIMFWHILTGQIGKKMKEAEKLYGEHIT